MIITSRAPFRIFLLACCAVLAVAVLSPSSTQAQDMAMEKTIIDLETKFWDAIVKGDVKAATDLLGEKSLLAGAQGVADISKETYAQMAEAPNWKLHAFKLSDVIVKFPAENMALIAYKVAEDVTVDGKPLKFEAADTSVWLNKDGKWINVLHTESILGDPFGRDKKK